MRFGGRGIWGEGDEERTAGCRSVVEIEGAGRMAAELLVSCRPRLDRFPYPLDYGVWTRDAGGDRTDSLPLVGFRAAILPKGFGRGDQVVS